MISEQIRCLSEVVAKQIEHEGLKKKRIQEIQEYAKVVVGYTGSRLMYGNRSDLHSPMRLRCIPRPP